MILLLSLLLPLVVIAYNNPMDKVGIFDPSSLQINQEYYLGKKIKNYTLLTEKGFTNVYNIIDGKATILQLAYYTCDAACPLITENTLKSLNELKDKNYNVLVVSFDKKDNIDTLKSYKAQLEEKYGSIPSNWTFALLSPEDITKFTQDVGFKFFYSEKDKTFAHTNVIIFISPSGTITRYLFGINPSSKDIRLALANARIEKPSMSTIIDAALLACYRYDPVRSRYVLDPLIIFPIAGILLLISTGFIAMSFKKEV